MNRKLVVLLVSFFLSGIVNAQIAGYPDFELVESTPIGTILDNPEVRNAHEVWLEMIGGAKKSLDFEEFYISDQPGEPLEDILAAIVAAGERGVKVRIIADASMYKTYPTSVDTLGKHRNIATRVIDFRKLSHGVQHSKYFLVDGEQVYLGSQNFDWRSLKHIHELGVRIRHKKAVSIYQDIFNLDWQLADKNDPALTKKFLTHRRYPTPFRLIEEGNDTLLFWPTMSPKGLITDSLLWDERNIVDLIASAHSDVMCQFLTYSPATREKQYYPVLDNALRNAAARGVKVRMIVSDWDKEHPTVDYLKSLSLVPNVQVKFSDIPEWSGGYVSYARVEHCKYLVIDSSEFWLGTANWEKGYFYNLRNVGVVGRNQKLTGILRGIFLKSWDGPYTEPVKAEVDYTPREHGERK